METVCLGSVPNLIMPAEIGDPAFSARMRDNALAFIGQIRRHYGPPPIGAGLFIRTARRSYGRTSNVTLMYQPEIERAFCYSLAILLDTRAALADWDDISQNVLNAPQQMATGANIWTGLPGTLPLLAA